MNKFRQNLVTYPFDFKKTTEDEFFKQDKAGIYIHIPFCNQKCKFCNFEAYKIIEEDYIDDYIDILKRHIKLYKQKKYFREYLIDCVNFGGGNPGLLPVSKIAGILELVKDNFEILPEAEYSIEFDPINVTEEKLIELKALGFNRISMGVQSFNDEILSSVGRIHSGKDAIEAHQLMKKSGFKNVNLDLVFPFPNLEEKEWQETIDQLVELDPAAISTYGLELWPGTPFYKDAEKGKFKVCSSETDSRMYEYANKKIIAAGYDQLTVYGYVKKEYKAKFHCKYMEEYYWNNKAMLGFGVGAMNYIEDASFINISKIKEYKNLIQEGKLPIAFGKHLTHDDKMRRFVIRGLKKTKVSISDFKNRYDREIEEYFKDEISSCVKQGFIEIEGDELRLTLHGCNFNTNVYKEFMKPEDFNTESKGKDDVHWGLSKNLDAALAGEYIKE